MSPAFSHLESIDFAPRRLPCSPPPCRRCSGQARRPTGLRGRHPVQPRATDCSGRRAIGAGLPGPAGEPHRQPQRRLPEQRQSPVARPVRCQGGKRRHRPAAGGRQPMSQRCRTTPLLVRVSSYCSRLAMPGAARTNVLSVTCSTRNLARLPLESFMLSLVFPYQPTLTPP